MLGPGGGAATIATAGRSNSSERTNATFLVNDDIRFHNMSRDAGTYLSCNHKALTNKILSGCKVSSCLHRLDQGSVQPKTFLRSTEH